MQTSPEILYISTLDFQVSTNSPLLKGGLLIFRKKSISKQGKKNGIINFSMLINNITNQTLVNKLKAVPVTGKKKFTFQWTYEGKAATAQGKEHFGCQGNVSMIPSTWDCFLKQGSSYTWFLNTQISFNAHCPRVINDFKDISPHSKATMQ